MDNSMFQCINVLGLALNAIGACLLIAFTSPGLNVTEKGDYLVGWTNNNLPPEQRAINIRKHRIHKCGFKTGIMLLVIGYILQLLATIL